MGNVPFILVSKIEHWRSQCLYYLHIPCLHDEPVIHSTKEICGVGDEKGKGKGRYQGLKTWGKPSAAVIQMEQREGNTLLHKHTSHVTTEKNNCNVLFKDITFAVHFPLDNLFIFKTKCLLYLFFSFLFKYMVLAFSLYKHLITGNTEKLTSKYTGLCITFSFYFCTAPGLLKLTW